MSQPTDAQLTAATEDIIETLRANGSDIRSNAFSCIFPILKQETARGLAAQQPLREALRDMLASAKPHPVDNPTMAAAWKKGEAALLGHPVSAKQDEKVQELLHGLCLSLADDLTLGGACSTAMGVTKSTETMVALLYAQQRLKDLIATLGYTVPSDCRLTGLQPLPPPPGEEVKDG